MLNHDLKFFLTYLTFKIHPMALRRIIVQHRLRLAIRTPVPLSDQGRLLDLPDLPYHPNISPISKSVGAGRGIAIAR